MALWEVKERYVVEETYHVEAPTKEEAMDMALGSDAVDWERIRNFALKAKRIKPTTS